MLPLGCQKHFEITAILAVSFMVVKVSSESDPSFLIVCLHYLIPKIHSYLDSGSVELL